MKLKGIFIFVLFGVITYSYGQGKFNINNKSGSDNISFKFINNLIIMPVEVNGVELSFILDTGVSKPIIFNFLNITDSLKIKNAEKIFLRGLGEGDMVEAYKSKNNVFKVGEAININQDLYAVHDASLNFAPRLGVPVHGIIGFDLLKDFVVDINYGLKRIKLTNPKKYSYKDCRKCERLNLEFYNNKPYLNASVKVEDQKIPVKLLIDSGGSDALWLFEDATKGVLCKNKSFDDFLGHGLSGSVYGKRSRIDEFSLKSFSFKNANVAFPDSSSVAYAKSYKGRNGSLAGNILKRFNIILDYTNAIITLKKNRYFKDSFSYNNAGIEIEHNGYRLIKEKDYTIREDHGTLGMENTKGATAGNRIVFDTKYKMSLKPAFSIVELRKGSPAELAGLKLNDVIILVNGKESFKYSLQEITYLFFGAEGKSIKMKVDRDGKLLDFSFRLKDIFK